ncbi:MAG: glyoxalase/bleomycin resistance/dioxygenase family protein [Bacteroidales bacterium]|nr:glyoxalase/bleomycin resistance/dioxygenase family protein [Bacteroidales bacterium]
MNLNHCIPVLFVKDASIARDFYVNVLGFTVIMDNGGLNYAFKEGLAVWQINPDNIIPQSLGMEAITQSNTPSRFELCFETEDLDTIHQTLKVNQTTFLHEINTEIWGQRTIRFYDPDRHLIEVGEAMPIFLKRIFEEEGRDLEATAKRTYMPIEALKQIVNLS